LVSAVASEFGAAVVFAGVDPVSRLDAARLQVKIDKINKNVAGLRSAAPLRTPVTEAELNSYLRYELGDKLPPGVKDPWVSMLGSNRVSGRAIVDLAQVSQGHKSTGMMDPYNYLTGSVPITADGVLTSKNGVASFVLESGKIASLGPFRWDASEIVTYYSKSAAVPEGVSIAKPFPLPPVFVKSNSIADRPSSFSQSFMRLVLGAGFEGRVKLATNPAPCTQHPEPLRRRD
jgi:hypothetical protein